MRRYLLIIGVIVLLALCVIFRAAPFPDGPKESAGQNMPEETTRERPFASPTPCAADAVETLYEAEDAILEGLEIYTGENRNGATAKSGAGYVGVWDAPGKRLIFHVEVPAAGMYALTFLSAADGEESYNTVIVNDRVFYDALHTEGRNFAESGINAALKEGANVVVVETGWGFIYLDSMRVTPAEGIDPGVYRVDKTLSDPKATDNTRRLMSYLIDQYGEYTLSGQYNSYEGIDSPEIQEIRKLTGKYPAILGFDLSDYSLSRVAHGAETEQTAHALRWAAKGGIVTFTWHWNAPKDLLNSQEHPWWEGFYTDATTFDLERALGGQDPEGYDLILRDIDAISEQLKVLAKKDIPVLWRPLHEGSGGWFWWGAHGPERYIELWRLMYARMTETHGLHNLIWVYSGQDADWYPGDDCVDIIAEDIYTQPRDYESHYHRFERALAYTGADKIIALSENGAIPDPDLMYADNARWSFFITWNSEFVVDHDSRHISDRYNSLGHFIKIYHHDRVITLDELPDLDRYPME